MTEWKRFQLTIHAFVCCMAALGFVTLPTICVAVMNNWDETLEGGLPLPTSYSLDVADPNSGVMSTTADTGETILRLSDTSTSSRPGRINRGNWSNVSGVTLHARMRFGQSEATVMGFQLNDGLADGRLAWKWSSDQLSLATGTADAGQPSFISAPVNTWIEFWIVISGARYKLYTFDNGVWNLRSVGSTAPPGTGGAVYIGSSSVAGRGVMDLDFWRLETTGSYEPGSSSAPAVLPLANLPVSSSTSLITTGQSTNITVFQSQLGYNYQLRKEPGNTNVGSPATGNGDMISLPTGPLNATTTFNVLAIASTNPTCTQQLTATKTITVAAPVTSVAEAKKLTDGSIISLTGRIVAGRTSSAYWIEDADHCSGIKVISSSVPAAGSLAYVIGTLATAGERCLTNVMDEHFMPHVADPKPVGLKGSTIGGGRLNDYTPGIEGASGLNNIGLLVRTWGRVTAIGEGYYYVDDGSSLIDGTETDGTPNVGVRVIGDPSTHSQGEFVTFNGVVSCFVDSSSHLRRAIIPIIGDCTPPNAGLAVGALPASVCPGQSTSITVSASEVGINYQLRKSPGNVNVGSPVAGNGGIIYLPTEPIFGAATFTIIATNPVTGCAAVLNTLMTVFTNDLPAATLAVTASPRVVISGQSTNISVAFSQVGVSYQLRNNADNTLVGSPAMGTGSTLSLSTGVLTSDSTFNVLATNTSGCSAQLDSTATVTVEPEGTIHSKVGIHTVCGPRGLPNFSFLQFCQACADAGHPVAIVKCLDDFSAATEAKQASSATLTVGRLNEINNGSGGMIDLQGMDQYVGQPAAQVAAYMYSLLKPEWQKHPQIDVWEVFNEWSWHWAWQADFLIAIMDLAENDGFRVALYGCSGGNPPEAFWPDIARACARAKAHGGHMLSLHEYSWDGLLKDAYQQHGDDVVLRYRRLYNYLATQNADCPLILTETGQNGGGTFCGVQPFIEDYTWYDAELKKDPYVIGCTAWILGDCGWGGSSFVDALPALADYISTN